MRALAERDGSRIRLITHQNSVEFEETLAACKRVNGGRFDAGQRHWHYPLSIDTCLALRRTFGAALSVGKELAAWYRQRAAEAHAHAELAAATDATLERVPPALSGWLRPYQRAGAAWIAQGYRYSGLVADKPGVGKTSEMIAGLVEAGVTGPVLVVCPKKSVRLVWGRELQMHVPDVPQFLCLGNRDRREKVLSDFAEHVRRFPNELSFVVVVAEMLRVKERALCLDEETGEPYSKCPSEVVPHQEESLHVPDPKKKVVYGLSFPSLFDEALLGGGWAAVVLDESQRLLGSLTVVKGNLKGQGLRYLPERKDSRRYALSGTPFGRGGRVHGMFGTLHWLWPDEYTSFWKWADDYFRIEDKVINRQGKTVRKIVGLKDGEGEDSVENFLNSLGPRILRRTKEEALPGLPRKNIIEVPCEMLPEQRKQFDELAVAGEVTGAGLPLVVNGMLALRMRERQIANGQIYVERNEKVVFTGVSGKLEALYEKLEERGVYEGGKSVVKLVVASEFNQFLNAVERHLDDQGVPCFRVDGWTSDRASTDQIDAWQRGEGEERVFLLNSKAGGLSITLDAADEMHILDEMDNPEDNEQLEDRIHRASREHQVTIYYYRTEGSIDYAKAHSVELKRRIQHSVLDGRRGVPDLREIMREIPKEM